MPDLQILEVRPFDPLIVGDGKPLTMDLRRNTLPWVHPSIFAGSFRTLLGKRALGNGTGWNDLADPLRSVEFTGPFLKYDTTLFFPAPKDLIVHEEDDDEEDSRPVPGNRKTVRKTVRLKPVEVLPEGSGCDTPCDLLPIEITDDFKPADAPAFWSAEKTAAWLADPEGFNEIPAALQDGDPETPEYLNTLPMEERFHVQIDPKTQTAEEGQLFSTTGLRFRGNLSVHAVVRHGDGETGRFFEDLKEGFRGIHPLGGERRLAEWRILEEPPAGSECPKNIRERLKGVRRVRMILATPAIFRDGWKPGWIDGGKMEGSPPSGNGLTLQLVSAVLDRWQPISGWDYRRKGPKPVRRMVPAGSVYFFKVVGEGDGERAADLWLKSVCDDQQDRRDGFGLSLWGVW